MIRLVSIVRKGSPERVRENVNNIVVASNLRPVARPVNRYPTLKLAIRETQAVVDNTSIIRGVRGHRAIIEVPPHQRTIREEKPLKVGELRWISDRIHIDLLLVEGGSHQN